MDLNKIKEQDSDLCTVPWENQCIAMILVTLKISACYDEECVYVTKRPMSSQQSGYCELAYQLFILLSAQHERGIL